MVSVVIRRAAAGVVASVVAAGLLSAHPAWANKLEPPAPVGTAVDALGGANVPVSGVSEADLARVRQSVPAVGDAASLRIGIAQAARASGLSPAVVARRVAAEADAARVVPGGSVTAMAASPGRQVIDKPRAAGDIFFTSSYLAGQTWLINHGHVGLFASLESVVQATSAGTRNMPRTLVTVIPDGRSRLMSVSTSQAVRNSAVAIANSRVGSPYNYNFAFNRQDTKALNCSQLVWLSYLYASGWRLDLDRNKGNGVYPVDVRDHPAAVTYLRR